MKTTIDRQTGKPYRYDPALSVIVRGFHTVGRYQTDYPKCGQTIRYLSPSRLTPAKFAELNPGKVQP
jgi:hypothetical protein